MARPVKRSERGKGYCGSPGCIKPKAHGHFLCKRHLKVISAVKEELEADSASAFIRGKGDAPKSHHHQPTCCAMGCFEPRIPPNSHCFEHAELESVGVI